MTAGSLTTQAFFDGLMFGVGWPRRSEFHVLAGDSGGHWLCRKGLTRRFCVL
jgi:hypothetical protein